MNEGISLKSTYIEGMEPPERYVVSTKALQEHQHQLARYLQYAQDEVCYRMYLYHLGIRNLLLKYDDDELCYKMYLFQQKLLVLKSKWSDKQFELYMTAVHDLMAKGKDRRYLMGEGHQQACKFMRKYYKPATIQPLLQRQRDMREFIKSR